MTPFLQLALVLALIIFAAKAAGYAALRLGQPSVLGELLVGVVLGPSLLDVLHAPFFTDAHLSEVVHELAELGVLLLMFLAGLELNINELLHTGRAAGRAGLLGVVFPLGLGVLVGVAFGTGLPTAIFIGLILSATSVSISAQTLIELKALRSRVGLTLLGAAVFDDILVVLGLSVFLALYQPGAADWGSVAIVLARMAFYIAAGVGIGLFLPRLSRRMAGLPISQGLTAFAVVVLLIYGWSAEVFGGIAAITGAFLAGLMLARSAVRERIEGGISALAYGLFVPVFFVSVGLTADIRQLGGSGIALFAAMLAVGILGKVIGAGAGAWSSGFSRREALQLGVGMMSRGEVGLIVASVGVAQGLIGQEEFSAVVGMVVATTLLTPPALRYLFRQPAAPPKPMPTAPAEPVKPLEQEEARDEP